MGWFFKETKDRTLSLYGIPIGLIYILIALIPLGYVIWGGTSQTTTGKVVSIENSSFLIIFPTFTTWEVQYAYTGSEAITNEWTWNGNYSVSQLENMVGKNCTITSKWYTIQKIQCD